MIRFQERTYSRRPRWMLDLTWHQARGHWCPELGHLNNSSVQNCVAEPRGRKWLWGRGGGSGTEADGKSKAPIRRSEQRADLTNESLAV